MSPPLLSVIMIAKNEEEHLQRCLPTLDGVADEVVLVDTGSSDRTLEIARKARARIFHFPWNGNESDARNVSVREARGTWLWMVDADEEVSPELGREIRSVLPTLDRHGGYNSLSLVWENQHPGGLMSLMRVLRVARHTKDFGFTGSIHPEGAYREKTWSLQGRLRHDGYLWTDDLLRRKGAHMRHHLEPLCEGEKPPLKRLCEYLTVLSIAGPEKEFAARWRQLERYSAAERLGAAGAPFWLENLGNYLRHFALRDDFASGAGYAEEALAAFPGCYAAAFHLLQRAVRNHAWHDVPRFATPFEGMAANADVLPHHPVFPDVQIPTAREWSCLARVIGENQDENEIQPAALNAHSLPATLTLQAHMNRVRPSNDPIDKALLRTALELQRRPTLLLHAVRALQQRNEQLLSQTTALSPARLLGSLLRSELEDRGGHPIHAIKILRTLAFEWSHLPWLMRALQNFHPKEPVRLGLFSEPVLHLA